MTTISIMKYYELTVQHSKSGFKESLLKARGLHYFDVYNTLGNQFNKKINIIKKIEEFISFILFVIIALAFADWLTNDLTILLKEYNNIVSNLILSQWDWIALKAFLLILINRYILSSVIIMKYENKAKKEKEEYYQKIKTDIIQNDFKEIYELSMYNLKRIEDSFYKAEKIGVEINEIEEFIKGLLVIKKNKINTKIKRNRIKIDLIKSYAEKKVN